MSSRYSIIKMELLKIFLTIFFLFNVSIAKEDQGRIIGGKAASLGQFPYQIALLRDGNKWCGGSIIAANIIATAAHCTEGVDASSFTVIAGSNDLSKQLGVQVGVARYINHPNYIDDGGFNYDVSLLVLTDPLSYSSTIKPIPLPGANELIYTDSVGLVSGFGAIDSQMKSTPTLKYVNVRLWSIDECRQISPITDFMMCAGELHGQQSSCQGDSGGPLVVNNKLYGIVSHGPGCGNPGPAIYTSVVGIRDWITQMTGL